MTSTETEADTSTGLGSHQGLPRNDDQSQDGMDEQESEGEITRNGDLPASNSAYARLDYWDDRFAKEDKYEWLVSYVDVAAQITPYIEKDHRILIVGCGNSDFSADLFDAGYENIVNIDFSEVVIEAMRRKNADRVGMKWEVMDMTDMKGFQDDSFDCVLDKAAMDALMTQEGDVWNPDLLVVRQAFSMCKHISRILKPGGYHLQISFQQAHFRKKYLLGLHGDEEREPTIGGGYEAKSDGSFSDTFRWSFREETIGAGSGCFHHFLYVMRLSE